MSSAERSKLLHEVARTVRQEIRAELVLAGIVGPAEYWHIEDREALRHRLRRLLQELERPDAGVESAFS